jgi:hypothetical protein
MKERNTLFLVHFIVYCFHFTRGNQYLQYWIQVSTPKSGLLHLTSHPYCKKSRSAKVKDGIINLILRNYLVDWYKYKSKQGNQLMFGWWSTTTNISRIDNPPIYQVKCVGLLCHHNSTKNLSRKKPCSVKINFFIEDFLCKD